MAEEGPFDAKRRIVGAAILVTVAVVVLPVLLRQPPQAAAGRDVLTVRRAAHGVQVAMASAPHQAAPTATSPQATSPQTRSTGAPQPIPASAPPQGMPAPGTSARPREPEASSPAPKARRPLARGSANDWYVQVGAYVNPVYGIAFGRRLRAQGFPAHVKLTRLPTGRGVVVVLGPYGKTQAQNVKRAVAQRDRVQGLVIQEAGATR